MPCQYVQVPCSNEMAHFDITPEALQQIKRLDGIFCNLLSLPVLAIPNTHPQDIVNLVRIVKLVRRLPETTPGEDLTILIHPNIDPRKPYFRMQFGERVIELGDFQVDGDPLAYNEWVSITWFGAIFGLGSGVRTPQSVNELEGWINGIAEACRELTITWFTKVGSGYLGHVHYPIDSEGGYI